MDCQSVAPKVTLVFFMRNMSTAWCLWGPYVEVWIYLHCEAVIGSASWWWLMLDEGMFEVIKQDRVWSKVCGEHINFWKICVDICIYIYTSINDICHRYIRTHAYTLYSEMFWLVQNLHSCLNDSCLNMATIHTVSWTWDGQYLVPRESCPAVGLWWNFVLLFFLRDRKIQL